MREVTGYRREYISLVRSCIGNRVRPDRPSFSPGDTASRQRQLPRVTRNGERRLLNSMCVTHRRKLVLPPFIEEEREEEEKEEGRPTVDFFIAKNARREFARVPFSRNREPFYLFSRSGAHTARALYLSAFIYRRLFYAFIALRSGRASCV